MWLVKLAVGLAFAYAALVAATYWAQTRLLFPAGAAGGAPDPLPEGARIETVRASDGVDLALVRYDGKDAARPAILGFGGNAWNAAAMAGLLHDLYPDHSIAVPYYRGYPPSGGRPGADAIRADALAVHDRLDAPAGVVAVGFSIGSGFAAYLAGKRPVAGLILVTPFDSLIALARHHYPWAPVGLALRHRIDTADYLKAVDAPTAIIVAADDTIVPAARSAPLPGLARRLVLSRTIPGVGHNDLYGHIDFAHAMRGALRLIEAPEGAEPGHN